MGRNALGVAAAALSFACLGANTITLVTVTPNPGGAAHTLREDGTVSLDPGYTGVSVTGKAKLTTPPFTLYQVNANGTIFTWRATMTTTPAGTYDCWAKLQYVDSSYVQYFVDSNHVNCTVAY